MCRAIKDLTQKNAQEAAKFKVSIHNEMALQWSGLISKLFVPPQLITDLRSF